MGTTRYGRLGHQFKDIISAIIIAKAFNIGYLHTGWKNVGIARLREWEPFFAIGNGEICIPHIAKNKLRIQSSYWDKPPKILSTRNTREYLGYEQVKALLDQLDDGDILNLAKSTRVNHKVLRQWENKGLVPEGTYTTFREILRQKFENSRLATSTSVDFENKAKTTVAVYVRSGGKHENYKQKSRRNTPKELYDIAIERLHQKYGDLEVKYYTQGPLDKLDGDYSDCDIQVCDEKFPQLYSVLKSLIVADVFIKARSATSFLIGMYRYGPTISPRSRRLRLPNTIIKHPMA